MKLSVSGWQTIWIYTTAETVTILGLQISPTIQIAKQDAWLSILIGGLFGIVLTCFIVLLGMVHSSQTLVSFSQSLLGKGLGKLIVLPFFIAWYLRIAVILRSFSDFIQLILLDRTPVWIIMVPLLVLITYLAYSAGITGIGRYSEIVGPMIIVVLIISFFLVSGNIDGHYLLPLYADSGWDNILKGAIAPAAFFVDPFVLLVIVSFMKKPEKALSRSLIGVGITFCMFLTSTVMVLLVFGPNLAGKLYSPYFMLVRTIDILNFIQNLDIFVSFIWVFGVFGQLTLYMFITSYEVAQCLNVKSWRNITWYAAPLIFIIAIWIPDEVYVTYFTRFWTSVIFPICSIGIPLFLWFVTVLKRKAVKL